MKKTNQTKLPQKTPSLHIPLSSESFKTVPTLPSPHSGAQAKLPKEFGRVHSPNLQCKSPKRIVPQSRTPTKAPEPIIKSPNTMMMKQRPSEASQHEKTKEVIAIKLPTSKVQVRMPLGPKPGNNVKETVPHNIKKTERVAIVDLTKNERNSIIPGEHHVATPMQSDSNYNYQKNPHIVMMENKDTRKVQQTEGQNLKLDFSPMNINKDEKGTSQRELFSTKRTVTSPGADERRKKGSPSEKTTGLSDLINKTKYNNKKKEESNYFKAGVKLSPYQINNDMCEFEKTSARSPRSCNELPMKTEPCKTDRPNIELAQREKESQFYVDQLNVGLAEISKIKEDLVNEQRQSQDSIENMKEEIKLFAERIIDLAEHQAELALKSIDEEFSGLLNARKGAIATLDNFKAKFMQTKKYIEKSVSNKGQSTKSEHTLIKNKFADTIKSFDEAAMIVQNILREPIKVIPFERVSLFKKNTKVVFNELFSGCGLEDTVGTLPLVEINNLGDFENFLKSEESEDVLKIKPIKEKIRPNIVISFENKDIFENALQSTIENNRPTHHTTQIGSMSTNLFRTESEFLSSYDEGTRTPRLQSEADWEYDIESVENYQDEGLIQDLLESYPEEGQHRDVIHKLPDDLNLNKFENLLNRVNQQQTSRNDYLRAGKKSQVDEYEEFMSFLENKVRNESLRDASCQKLLFQSPAFKQL